MSGGLRPTLVKEKGSFGALFYQRGTPFWAVPPLSEDDPLAKAGWNYFLIHGDGSHGVHNPPFTLDVIKASLAALEPAVPE
jgi:hypothetical protein